MDEGVNESCILVLQKDVFVQFQSIQLATKLDNNSQMEMFFQLYHCVMSTNFKGEGLDIGVIADGIKQTCTRMPKEDYVNHEKLPDLELNKNHIFKYRDEDRSSDIKEQTTYPVVDEPSDLPTDSNAQNLEEKSLSVSFLESNQNHVHSSDTSDGHQDLNDLDNSHQIQDSTKTCELDVSASVQVGSTETFSCGLESDEKAPVSDKQLASSPVTSSHTSVRKGRRKSAPKRAAPAEDDDALDMQLLLTQDHLEDGDFLTDVAMNPVADEDHKATSPDSEMTDAYLLQQYSKDSSFELPTMVRGTNYGPMTSRLHPRISSIFTNNHNTSKNNHRNSISADVIRKQGHLRTTGGTGIKRNKVQFALNSSADCKSELNGADRLSDSGDISDEHGSTTGLLKCDFCSFTSHRRYNLNRHRRIHTGNMFKCESCGRKFNEPGKLKSHSCKIPVPRSPNKPMYTCDVCSLPGLKSIESLRQHILLEHDIDETFVCVSCNPQVIFHSPQEFKNHLETLHTVSSRYLSKSLCNECGREFKYLGSLKKHKESCAMSIYKAKAAVKVENSTTS
ncbi:zinc finger protein ZFAT-like [Gigantopelta aegis]|uniref:zinc finger protein ZFAT-like n=1 Tax=Gigantopelta aegis TaxID=1735272 RepID=UPI001B88A2FF|nr:zinc finger protein ZFAT-like [Gigantopelta aegis]